MKKPLNVKKSTSIFTFLGRLNVSEKISYGYSITIAVAIIGSSIGLWIGDSYEKKAQKLLTLANDQKNLILELEIGVLDMRSHPQNLVSVLGESIWIEYEKAKFVGDVERVRKIILNLDNFIKNNPNNIAIKSSEFKDLLEGYEVATNNYKELINKLWEEINHNSKSEQINNEAQQKVINLYKKSHFVQNRIKFEQLAEELDKIIEAANSQKNQAKAEFNKAEIFRLKIFVWTMLITGILAILLGFYSSREIARPLEYVNQIARRVTEQADFQLIAPIVSDDEVGSLANSLNQLVEWVGEYTQQLEIARRTLEQRVEERTQELTEALNELKETQSQLIQTEKMSSLGQLVAGLAHEINNPINFIYGNIEYIKKYSNDLIKLVELYQQNYPNPPLSIHEHTEEIDWEFLSQDLFEILASMKIGSERVREIIISLRNFSRLDESEAKEVDIHQGIESTLLLLNNRINQEIEVQKKYGNIPLIKCYPAQLNQVFFNILSNAIDAVTDSKWQTWAATHSPNQLKPSIIITTDTCENNKIRVSIWNNGSPIAPEIKAKLFDPFFTTKAVGKGTGLGLSVCYQIIHKHQGKIEFFSEPGAGTEFIIILPKTFN